MDLVKVNLVQLDLVKVALVKMNLVQIDLVKVNMVQLDLIKVDLVQMDMVKVDLIKVVGDVANGDDEDGGKAGGEEEAGKLAPEGKAHPHHVLPVHRDEAHPVGGDGVLEHLLRAPVLHEFGDKPSKHINF